MGQPARHRPSNHWPAGRGGTGHYGPANDAQASSHRPASKGGNDEDGPTSEAQTSRPIAHLVKQVGLPALIRKPIGQLTVFNREPHSGSGASEVSSWKHHFGTAFEFLAPFRTRNRRKHFNHLTISYVCLNL